MGRDWKISSSEILERNFIFSDGTVVPFAEIEYELRKRTKNLFINITGCYDPKYNIDPYVFLSAEFEGYEFRMNLLKEEIHYIKDDKKYYDYLAKRLISKFASIFFDSNWYDESKN